MDKYSQAMKEALASVGEQIIFHTLEFRHAGFKDEYGSPTAVRVVLDDLNLSAPLEANAPMNAGEWVTFIGLPFRIVPPSEDASSSPEVTIEMDNVGRIMEPYLEIGANSSTPIEVTYRPYLSGALEDGVQVLAPYTLLVTHVVSTPSAVKITAKMEDVTNKAFLWPTISAENYPTLAS